MPGKKKPAAKLDAIEVSAVIPADAKRLYEGWLDSKAHSDFTGGEAVIEPKVGGKHTAWDGYISGVTLALESGRRILQSWRTTEFPKDARDSRLEVLFAKAQGGTRITFKHTDIPPGQGESYKQGWDEFYFQPMKRYFSRKKPRAAS